MTMDVLSLLTFLLSLMLFGYFLEHLNLQSKLLRIHGGCYLGRDVRWNLRLRLFSFLPSAAATFLLSINALRPARLRWLRADPQSVSPWLSRPAQRTIYLHLSLEFSWCDSRWWFGHRSFKDRQIDSADTYSVFLNVTLLSLLLVP